MTYEGGERMQASQTRKSRIMQVTTWVPETEQLGFACQQVSKAGLGWAMGKHAGKYAVFRRRVVGDPEDIPAGDVPRAVWVTHWKDADADTNGEQACTQTQSKGSVVWEVLFPSEEHWAVCNDPSCLLEDLSAFLDRRVSSKATGKHVTITVSRMTPRAYRELPPWGIDDEPASRT